MSAVKLRNPKNNFLCKSSDLARAGDEVGSKVSGGVYALDRDDFNAVGVLVPESDCCLNCCEGHGHYESDTDE